MVLVVEDRYLVDFWVCCVVVLDVVVIDVYGGFVCFVFWVVDYIGCLCVVCECYECCDNDVFVDEFVYSFCNLV